MDLNSHYDELLFAALLGIAVFLVAAAFQQSPRRSWSPAPSTRDEHRPPRRSWSPALTRLEQRPVLSEVGEQLNAVMDGTFQKRRLLNPAEYRVFRIIESEVSAAHKGYRVFAQTSLGEVLQSPSTDAFRSINAKRVDILIVDRAGWPALAVEYQGSQHYQGTAAARDAIKKEALRKAGVRYLEVTPEESDDQIRYHVCELLGWKENGSNPARGRMREATVAG